MRRTWRQNFCPTVQGQYLAKLQTRSSCYAFKLLFQVMVQSLDDMQELQSSRLSLHVHEKSFGVLCTAPGGQ